jgi:hypothetical protein
MAQVVPESPGQTRFRGLGREQREAAHALSQAAFRAGSDLTAIDDVRRRIR